MNKLTIGSMEKKGLVELPKDKMAKWLNNLIQYEDLSCEGVKTVNDILCALSQVRATTVNLTVEGLVEVMKCHENCRYEIDDKEELAKSIFKLMGGSDEN